MNKQQTTIDNDNEHAIAMSCLEVLMDYDPESGTDEANELLGLALAIERYEKERWPLW